MLYGTDRATPFFNDSITLSDGVHTLGGSSYTIQVAQSLDPSTLVVCLPKKPLETLVV